MTRHSRAGEVRLPAGAAYPIQHPRFVSQPTQEGPTPGCKPGLAGPGACGDCRPCRILTPCLPMLLLAGYLPSASTTAIH
jgi:hypothetical protein